MFEKLGESHPRLKNTLDTTVAGIAGSVIVILDTLNTLTPPLTEAYIFQEFSKISNWKIGVILTAEEIRKIGIEILRPYPNFFALRSASRNFKIVSFNKVDDLTRKI